jgi:hypothetical protein
MNIFQELLGGRRSVRKGGIAGTGKGVLGVLKRTLEGNGDTVQNPCR